MPRGNPDQAARRSSGVAALIDTLVLGLALSLPVVSHAADLRLQWNARSAYYPDGYTGIEEAEILSGSPDANTGGNWDMIVGSDDKGGLHRLLFRWHLANLAPLFADPDLAVVSVQMRLGEWYTRNKPNQKLEVYRMLPANRGWVVGKTGPYTWETPEVGAATWNACVSGTRAWAGGPGCGEPGVDYDPTPVALFYSDGNTQGMRPRYMAAFDLPIDLVRSWIVNPAENDGLLIRGAVETGDRLVYVIGSEHQREDYGWHLHHPELVVTYLDKRSLQRQAPGYIVRAGAPGCTIITAEDASPGELYAATELISHLREMTGAELTRLREDQYEPDYGPCISIGRTKLSCGYVSDKELEAYGDEGYRVFAKSGNLILSGGRKRGSLYAVYEFLERLGVRWYSPDYTVVPKRATIPLAVRSFEYAPKFWYRDQFWNNGTSPEWLARMRANGEYARIPDEMGGSAHTLYGCHSFSALIPPAEFLAEHPEWFALKEDGSRSPTEYCLTNTALRDYVRAKVCAEVEATEGWAEYIWVSQNDGSLSGCFCAACTAERERHGGKDKWAANTVSFVNQVAVGLAEKSPRVKIKTLAYSYTTAPPTDLTVADNVTIELCGNFAPGTADPHTKLAQSWAKLAQNIEVYTYGGSNFGYWWPYPNIWEMGAQYARALQAGVSAFYVQGTAVGRGSGLVDLRAYLSGRLAWDPGRSVERETRDFCDGFYGPAGKYVYGYIRGYADYVRKERMRVDGGWGNADLWRDWVTREAMDRGDALFQKALQAVSGNPIYTNHVQRAYLEVLWGGVMVHLNPKPEIVNGNYVLVAGAQADTLLAKTRLFHHIMAENAYTMMSEPVGYIPGRSQLDAVSANYPAVEMANGSSRLWIVPSLGGRIISWDVDALGGNIFRISQGSDPYSAGYEELSGLPTRTTPYEVVSAAPTAVLIRGAVTDAVESTRRFELDPARNALSITTEYKNVSSGPVSFAIRTHPEFSFGLFGKGGLYTLEADGKPTQRVLWSERNPEGSTYVDAATVGRGVWVLGDTQKGIGLINRFELPAIKTMYTYHGESYGGINLELWGPEVTLQPQGTWRLSHSYEVTTDLQAVLEAESRR